jgi:hypothetical protein
MAQHQMSRGRRPAVYLGLVRDPDRSPDLGDHVLNLLTVMVAVICFGLTGIVIDPRQHPAYAVLAVIIVGTWHSWGLQSFAIAATRSRTEVLGTGVRDYKLRRSRAGLPLRLIRLNVARTSLPSAMLTSRGMLMKIGPVKYPIP